MEQISNEKFGQFIIQLRKEKELTQKDLAEKLYVSDKTISKWERGLSFPNVTLLIPIAEVLEVTVTELLKGERLNDGDLKKEEVEQLIVSSLDLRYQKSFNEHSILWKIIFCICTIVMIAEFRFIILRHGLPLVGIEKNTFLMSLFMLIIAGYFCFFAKSYLPNISDDNKLNEPFRIKILGLTISNKNWFYICRLIKVMTLSAALLYPYITVLVLKTTPFEPFWNWIEFDRAFRFIIWGVLIISVYFVGKKHE